MNLTRAAALSLSVISMLAGAIGLPGLARASSLNPDQQIFESVVVVYARDLDDFRAAGLVQIRPGQVIPWFEVERVCSHQALQADDLLIYRPDQARCQSVSRAERLQLNRLIGSITGRFPRPETMAHLASGPVTIAAAHASTGSRGATCSCPGNNPPQGSVGCPAQARNAGARIADIEFQATDPDGDPLFEQFSYQFGAGAVEAGLPAPLTSSCTHDPGSLLCTISGIGPSEAGDLQLMLAVTDGGATLDLGALLQLTAVGGQPIYNDVFEAPICP